MTNQIPRNCHHEFHYNLKTQNFTIIQNPVAFNVDEIMKTIAVCIDLQGDECMQNEFFWRMNMISINRIQQFISERYCESLYLNTLYYIFLLILLSFLIVVKLNNPEKSIFKVLKYMAIYESNIPRSNQCVYFKQVKMISNYNITPILYAPSTAFCCCSLRWGSKEVVVIRFHTACFQGNCK